MKKHPKVSFHLRSAASVLFWLGAATGVGFLFAWVGFPETNIVLLFQVAVLIIARYTTGFVYGLVASLLGTFAFNFFFTVPVYTFEVADPSYLLTFATMTITSVVTSTLTFRMKRNAQKAMEREHETELLYHLTNRLSDAKGCEDMGFIALSAISEMLGCQAGLLFVEASGQPESTFLQYTAEGVLRREVSEDSRTALTQCPTKTVNIPSFEALAIHGQERLLAYLLIPDDQAAQMSDGQQKMVRSMTESLAMAMDRFHAAQEQQRYREETQQERYRSNLLRAISHDLRTPLSGIMGAGEMIRNMSDKSDQRWTLAQNIWNEAVWLKDLVENILSLTRLEEGRLAIEKQPEAVEEILGSALSHMEVRAPQYDIRLLMPDDFLMVPMDAKLIVQVLVNLLDNAVKHTPQGNEILLEMKQEGNNAIFAVRDRGEGIAPEDAPHLFERFYTTRRRGADAKRGIGLGLAICDAIVKAHGGTIIGQRREGGGAEFIFTLPMEEHHGQSA